MTRRINSWSFSRLQVFETCKYRAALQWRDKVPDTTPKTAADRGTAIHQEAEDYVRGKAPITNNLRHFQVDLSALAKHFSEGRVTCEEEWAFDSQWNSCDWKSGWLRLKCDAVCHLDPTHLVVIDYKTGKRFGNEIKHAEQLQLYALCALLRYPSVEIVTTELWYVDQNELASFVMKRSQLKKYLAMFDRRGQAFTCETEFKPNPNIHSCRYCPYSPAKQGDCEFGVDQDGNKNKPKLKPITFVKAAPSPLDAMFAEEAKAYVGDS